MSKSTAQRILTQACLKPHRLASDDLDFEAKTVGIIGLYLDPPHHAAVFCVGEKTAIQALDRVDSVLPLSPGRAERHGFEYCAKVRPISPSRASERLRPQSQLCG